MTVTVATWPIGITQTGKTRAELRPFRPQRRLRGVLGESSPVRWVFWMGGARSADGTGQDRSRHGSQQEVKQEHAVTFQKSLSSAFIMF